MKPPEMQCHLHQEGSSSSQLIFVSTRNAMRHNVYVVVKFYP